MKKINFIMSVKPQDQQAISHWFHISLFLIISTGLIIGIIQIRQFYSLYTAHTHYHNKQQQKVHSMSVITQHNQLTNQKKNLENRIAHMSTWTLKNSNPATLLKDIIHTFDTDTILSSWTWNKSACQLIIQVKNSAIPWQVRKKLSTLSWLNKIKLTSLQAHEASYTAHLTGIPHAA